MRGKERWSIISELSVNSKEADPLISPKPKKLTPSKPKGEQGVSFFHFLQNNRTQFDKM